MRLVDTHRYLNPLHPGIMHKYILFVILLSLVSGCSIGLVKTSDPAKELKYARRIDSNEGPLRVTESAEEPNRVIISWKLEHEIKLAKSFRVKYQTFYFDFVDIIAVPGILPNGKTYSIWLDTGHPRFALTTGLTILENDLAIYPLGEDTVILAQYGLCYLPHFQIGQAVITNPPCEYLQQQWEVKLLGLPIWRQKGILIGLSLMKDFGYIVFDNIRKEAEFAPTGHPFVPTQPKQWDSYQFEIKNQMLKVNIPIENQYFPSEFDTCGRYGMVVHQNMWERISSKLKTSKIKESDFLSGFLGDLPCYRTKTKNLNIGNQTVKNAEIIILPQNSLYLPDRDISISMKYFKNTVVVLDFERNLMWVRKNETD